MGNDKHAERAAGKFEERVLEVVVEREWRTKTDRVIPAEQRGGDQPTDGVKDRARPAPSFGCGHAAIGQQRIKPERDDRTAGDTMWDGGEARAKSCERRSRRVAQPVEA